LRKVDTVQHYLIMGRKSIRQAVLDEIEVDYNHAIKTVLIRKLYAKYSHGLIYFGFYGPFKCYLTLDLAKFS